MSRHGIVSTHRRSVTLPMPILSMLPLGSASDRDGGRGKNRPPGGPMSLVRVVAAPLFRGLRGAAHGLHRAAGRHRRPIVGISRTLFALDPRLAVHRAVADLEVGNEVLVAVGLDARNQRVAERAERITRRLDIPCRRKRGRGLRSPCRRCCAELIRAAW